MLTHSFPEGSDFMIRSIDHVNEYDFTHVHRHDYFEIFLFDQVSHGYQVIDFQRFDLTVNSLYIVCPNQIHLLKREPQEKGLVIQFTKAFLQNAINGFRPEWILSLNTTPHLKLAKQQFQETRSIFEQLLTLSIRTDFFTSHQVRHFFAYLIFHLLEIIKTADSVTSSDALSIQFLSLAEQGFSKERKVQHYAESLHVSPITLGRHVKKSYGKTPIEILHSMLLLEIKRLLVLGELSHKEISFKLHFDSPSSYSKFILTHTDVSPSQLRNQLMQIHKS